MFTVQRITAETVGDLKTTSGAELRALWARLRPRTEPPTGRRLIVRELAWSMQARERGDVDAETARLLRSAMRGATIEGGAAPAKKKSARRRRAKLETGTRLVREWGGSSHEVTVTGDGATYEYRGKTYKSLTEIAKQITGAHWSGPRFFGLNRKAAKP